MTRIVGSVLVRNEDIYLERALLNILDFCDEILVADHGSTDQTSAILAGLAARYPKIVVHRVEHPSASNDHIAPYAGTPTWIFGVDGDEIYDPVGLRRMREELLGGKYDEWWIVFGNVLHCTSLDIPGARATGHLSPPSKSMTKLFNFRLLKAVDPEAHHRLVGENKVFFDPESVGKRLNLHEEQAWPVASFRCLHTCFMPRSTLDGGLAEARQNVSESFDWVKQWKDRVRRWFGFAPARNYKHEKYRRGEAVTLDVGQFFSRGPDVFPPFLDSHLAPLLMFFRSKPIATVAINMRPVSGPWGGSSPFVWQLKSFLEARGYAVRYDLRRPADAILLIDPRDDLQSKAFGLREIAEHKKVNPRTRVIHRVNECDQRKKTSFMDAILEKGSEVADFTVFISDWLREYFVERWFDAARPHNVIYNGAAVRDFHPIGAQSPKLGEPLRVVTHHWSDNPLKGFDVYEIVDRMIARGDVPGFELWVIGRWPKGLEWQAAKTFPPAHGAKLGALLRQCHLYLTATRWEPCGMHHVEGAQCGLPLLYHRDGGGVVEAGERYGLGFTDDVKSALLAARDDYAELKRKVMHAMPSGDRMCLAYAETIQQILAARD